MTVPQRMLRRLILPSAVLGVMALAVAGSTAGAQDEERWHVQFTPYLMLAGLNGDIGLGGRTTEVDESFGDIFENLDFAVMGAVEARRGRWGLWSDLLYTDLGVEGEITGPIDRLDEFEFDSSVLIVSPGIAYRVTRPGPAAIDLLGGFRYWNVDNGLTVFGEGGGEAEFQDSQGWFDPIVGARLLADLSERLFLLGRGDIGGFGVGADFSWQALAGFGYRFDAEGRYSGIAAYRHIAVDYEDEDDAFLFDVAMSGPTVGFRFAW